MKDRRFLILFLFIALAGCGRHPIPEQSIWNGTMELPGGKALPVRMELNLSGGRPAGYFINGDQRTPIPEISREGDTLVFTFSEYGAEMRGVWDGAHWSGNYMRHRSDGVKSLKFTASPESTVPKT